MKRLWPTLFIFLAFACYKNNDSSITLYQWRMTKVEGTTVGNVNETIPLTISWPYTSGSCDVLDKFEESRTGNVVSVKAYGHVSSGICTDDAGIKTKTYNFSATTAGTYQLKFINPDSTIIPFTLIIN